MYIKSYVDTFLHTHTDTERHRNTHTQKHTYIHYAKLRYLTLHTYVQATHAHNRIHTCMHCIGIHRVTSRHIIRFTDTVLGYLNEKPAAFDERLDLFFGSLMPGSRTTGLCSTETFCEPDVVYSVPAAQCVCTHVFDGFCVPHTCTQFILERNVFCFVFLCSWCSCDCQLAKDYISRHFISRDFKRDELGRWGGCFGIHRWWHVLGDDSLLLHCLLQCLGGFKMASSRLHLSKGHWFCCFLTPFRGFLNIFRYFDMNFQTFPLWSSKIRVWIELFYWFTLEARLCGPECDLACRSKLLFGNVGLFLSRWMVQACANSICKWLSRIL